MVLRLISGQNGYTLHWNPWPLTFSYYSNPAYQLIDFVLGYLGYQVLQPVNSNWKSLSSSLFQVGSLILYFLCCVFFDKIWIPAPFILLSILLISAFMLSDGIVQLIFGNRLMVHLGNISFELFIVHQVLITILNEPIKGVFHDDGVATCLALFFVSLITADLFHRLVSR